MRSQMIWQGIAFLGLAAAILLGVALFLFGAGLAGPLTGSVVWSALLVGIAVMAIAAWAVFRRPT